MGSLSRCTWTDGPPCDDLVLAPEATLADPDRWPDHVCPEVARASVAVWAGEQVDRMYGNGFVPPDVRAWAASWPLPVGRWSLPKHVPPILAPLPSYGTAACILSTRPSFCQATVFGLVDGDDLPSSCEYTISGWPDDVIARFVERFDRWWRGENATGRRRGSKITRERAYAAWQRFEGDVHRPPFQSELATELGVTKRALRNALGPWRDFAREAEAVAHHARHIASVSDEIVARRSLRK